MLILGSFTSFWVCVFKMRFVFVRSYAGGREVELGSVSAPNTAREHSVQLLFECFKLARLKNTCK